MARRRKVRLTDKAALSVATETCALMFGWDEGEGQGPDERLTKLLDDAKEEVIVNVAKNTNSAVEALRKNILRDVGELFTKIQRDEDHKREDEDGRDRRKASDQEKELKTLRHSAESARAGKDIAERRAIELRKEAVDAIEERRVTERFLQGLAVRAGIIPSGALVEASMASPRIEYCSKEQRELAKDPAALAKAIDARLVELLGREKQWLASQDGNGDPRIGMSVLLPSDEGGAT